MGTQRTGLSLSPVTMLSVGVRLRVPLSQGVACRLFSSAAAQVIRTDCTNPYVNLAAESWMFTQGETSKETLFLWRNAPTIVIGRNQNPFKECNLERMKEDGVELVRRSSGGGAVYQDLGNSNFTFLSSAPNYDVSSNFNVIRNALLQFGVQAEVSGRNDMTVDGKKISGSAFKRSPDRCLHHGTLLADVDMSALQRLLVPSKLKLQSKGIDSVASRVVNLVEVNASIHHESLCDALQNAFIDRHKAVDTEVLSMSEQDLLSVPAVRQARDSLIDWEWKYGRTPQFSHNIEARYDWGTLDLHLDVKWGKITSAVLYTDALAVEIVPVVEQALQGADYTADSVLSRFNAALQQGDARQQAWAGMVEQIGQWVAQEVA